MVQFFAHEQIHAVADKAAATGPGLYLDSPLGVNTDSYDVSARTHRLRQRHLRRHLAG